MEIQVQKSKWWFIKKGPLLRLNGRWQNDRTNIIFIPYASKSGSIFLLIKWFRPSVSLVLYCWGLTNECTGMFLKDKSLQNVFRQILNFVGSESFIRKLSKSPKDKIWTSEQSICLNNFIGFRIMNDMNDTELQWRSSEDFLVGLFKESQVEGDG